jgi:hypothetical protein
MDPTKKSSKLKILPFHCVWYFYRMSVVMILGKAMGSGVKSTCIVVLAPTFTIYVLWDGYFTSGPQFLSAQSKVNTDFRELSLRLIK